MRVTALMIALLVAPFTTAAAAEQQVMSAADLQQLCGGSDHVSKNVCRVYILGVTQGITLGLSLADGKTHGSRPCVPAQISGESLEDTVKAKLDKRLAANPAEGEREAADVIGAALASAYPCTAAGAH
jgi:hypothetical protein